MNGLNRFFGAAVGFTALIEAGIQLELATILIES